MKDKLKYSTSQLFNFAPDSYFERTSRPIYAIVFLLPFIVFYELGTILINTDVLNQSQVRVAAFVWLQNFLVYLGFGSKLAWVAPPLVVVAVLTGLQLASRKRWRFTAGDIWPMAVECVLLAVPLIVLGLFLNSPAKPAGDLDQFAGAAIQVQAETVPACSSVTSDARSQKSEVRSQKPEVRSQKPEVRSQKSEVRSRMSEVRGPKSDVRGQMLVLSLRSSVFRPPSSVLSTMQAGSGGRQGRSLLADIVTGIGAGIYEELVFRLILICALMIVFQDVLRLSRKSSIILAVLVSAALFSAHHHIDFLSGQLNQTEPFGLTKFGFRTIAGVYFAVLFAIRGFGITAGTHAFYDIIATVINAAFFGSGN